MCMVLRLQARSASPGIFHVTGCTLDAPSPVETAQGEIQFTISSAQYSEFRWYWEKFDESPYHPAPAMAARIEAELASLGETLFQCLFGSTGPFASFWPTLADRLADVRIEIDAKGMLNNNMYKA